VEDLERAKSKYESDCQDETAEIKREKRRLNDLLTLREEEIEKLKDGDKLKSKLV
jgi:predicted nuclease with TOPRIM domain